MDQPITEEFLKSVGAVDQADLQARLQHAVKTSKSVEHIEALAEALTKNVLTMTEMMKGFQSTGEEAEAERVNAVAKTKAYDLWKTLPENDAQKIAIRADIEKEINGAGALALFSGDAFVKALNAPLSVNDPLYEDKLSFRKCQDYAMLYCAARDGLYQSKTNPDQLIVEKNMLKHAVKVLKACQVQGAELYERSINQALSDSAAGDGLEWVPQQILSRTLYQDVWLQLLVPSQFKRFYMPGPTFAAPIRTSRSRGYKMPESAASTDFYTIKATANNMNTSKVTFTAKKYAVLNFISDELVDDSAIAILDAIYEDLVFGAADGIEDWAINGSINLNDLDNAGTDTNRLWANTADAGDGIRLNTGAIDARNMGNGIRQAIQLNTNGNSITSAAFSRAELLATRQSMLKYGTTPDDLFMIVSPQTYITMLGFPEVATMEKFGPQATVRTGVLAKIDDIDIIVSPRQAHNYDNTGVFTNGTVVGGSSGVKTKSIVTMVNRKGWAWADRMQMRVESERAMLSGQRAILGSMRLDYQKMFKSSEPTEAQLINVAS